VVAAVEVFDVRVRIVDRSSTVGDMATARQLAIVIDAADPDALRDFWVAAMRYEPYGAAGAYRSATPPPGESGPKLVFQQVPEPQTSTKNRLHLDIIVGDGIETEAERLVALGARALTDRIDEVGTSWIVMADPEGNEFCLVYDT
jgi:predicted enzyme related to lactoylglutathione lyase